MEKLIPAGRIFYGVGIAGIGALQFVYPFFRPVLAPIPPEDTAHLKMLIYFIGLLLVLAGLLIAIGQYVKTIAACLALFFLLFVLFAHLPNRLKYHPDILGAWTDALKLLSLSGGALMISTIFPEGKTNAVVRFAAKIAPCGKYFFALMLIVFGIDHFLYTGFVNSIVPSWMPWTSFWTYFAAIALIGAGVAILIGFRPKLIGSLLAAMLFLWLIMVHIPRAARAPYSDNGNEWTSVFQCLAFCGMSLLYPFAGTAIKRSFSSGRR